MYHPHTNRVLLKEGFLWVNKSWDGRVAEYQPVFPPENLIIQNLHDPHFVRNLRPLTDGLGNLAYEEKAELLQGASVIQVLHDANEAFHWGSVIAFPVLPGEAKKFVFVTGPRRHVWGTCVVLDDSSALRERRIEQYNPHCRYLCRGNEVFAVPRDY